MDIKAKVHEVLPVQNVSETFKKRELIVEYAENPQYPEYIKFEAIGDKVNLFDKLKANDEVEVFFNLRGFREKESGFTIRFSQLKHHH